MDLYEFAKCNIACFECRKFGNCSNIRMEFCPALRKMSKSDVKSKMIAFSVADKVSKLCAIKYTTKDFEDMAHANGYKTALEMWEDLYVTGKGGSMISIGEKIGVSYKAVKRQLLKHNIPIRKKGGQVGHKRKAAA